MPDEKNSSPFYLKNTNYDQTKYLLFLGITFINLLLVVVDISFLINQSDEKTIISLVLMLLIQLITLIFLTGVTWCEYKAKFDFIKTSRNNIEYHHSPKFLHGWLPKKGIIKFIDIQSVRVVEIKSGLDLVEEKMKQAQFQFESFIEKNLSLELSLKNGQTIRIGERLSSSGIVQIAMLVESGAQIGNLIQNIAEKYPNVYNAAKSAMQSISKLFNKK